MANKRPMSFVVFRCNGCDKEMSYAPARPCNRCLRIFCNDCVEGEKCNSCESAESSE